MLLAAFRGCWIRQFPTFFAMALGRATGAGPPIREEPIDVVKRIYFANDRRHLLGEISGVHAGLIEPWGLGVYDGLSVAGPLDPLRMRLVGFFVHVITIEAGDHSDLCRLCGFGEVSEEIAITQEPAAVVIRNLGWVECHDSTRV